MEFYSPVPDWVLDWMASTWINNLVVGYPWSWPTLETLHFLGMCLLFGPIIVMDLRLLGFARDTVPNEAVHTLIPLTLLGFGINITTGIMFLFGDPYRYAINISFQLKMIFVLLAGLNALYFWIKVTPALKAAGPHDDPPTSIKVVGLASLAMWTFVLCLGRLIPYLGTG